MRISKVIFETAEGKKLTIFIPVGKDERVCWKIGEILEKYNWCTKEISWDLFTEKNPDFRSYLECEKPILLVLPL